MARKSPKTIMEDIEQVLEAVSELAPEKAFGGISLTQYDVQVKKSENARKEHTNAKTQVKNKENIRDNEDDEGLRMRQLIINGIIGDPDFGPDSLLYERCGFIRKSERKKGLTRKGNKKPEEDK